MQQDNALQLVAIIYSNDVYSIYVMEHDSLVVLHYHSVMSKNSLCSPRLQVSHITTSAIPWASVIVSIELVVRLLISYIIS